MTPSSSPSPPLPIPDSNSPHNSLAISSLNHHLDLDTETLISSDNRFDHPALDLLLSSNSVLSPSFSDTDSNLFNNSNSIPPLVPPISLSQISKSLLSPHSIHPDQPPSPLSSSPSPSPSQSPPINSSPISQSPLSPMSTNNLSQIIVSSPLTPVNPPTPPLSSPRLSPSQDLPQVPHQDPPQDPSQDPPQTNNHFQPSSTPPSSPQKLVVLSNSSLVTPHQPPQTFPNPLSPRPGPQSPSKPHASPALTPPKSTHSSRLTPPTTNLKPISSPTRVSSSIPAPQLLKDPTSSSRQPSGSGQSHNTNNTNSTYIPGRSRRQLGEFTLGKTLGAGSMGKVKLAVSSSTGEKIAIKIIPRHTSIAAAQQQLEKEKNKENNSATSTTRPDKDHLTSTVPTASFIEKAKIKDHSKEVRTIREASIVLLLHHPYVCGMKSMLVYPHHYYMLFEYVNGGQMLDYIISHGRLRERAARKFARQMGSALEYCHANSIVHRDLKIENILISKTGNIKIIDFGLSNLFSPNSNLQTFCGSLYFAAPELLNAKVYIGPEVDVWSFGIVLFVLVCGKVPFDDQSMPALHAKIKRGQVEYPTWLSSECKHILSRMLVTNPSNRASLHEVLNHPWMLKGYDGPPDPHIPHREPLRLNQVDPEVIKGMTGFEFGSEEKIEADLRAVLASEMYERVLKLYDEKRASGANGHVEPVYHTNHSGSSSSMSASGGGHKKELKSERDGPKGSGKTSKRFSGFGFYGKKMAGGLAAVLNTVGGNKNEEKHSSSEPTASLANGFESVLLNGQTLDSLDPTRGFHPLISIYYLVREKIERERIYGPGVFASSTLSVTGPPPPPAPPSVYKSTLSPFSPQIGNIVSAGNEIRSASSTVRSGKKNRTSLAGTEFDSSQREQTALILEMHQNGQQGKNRHRMMSTRPSTATPGMVSPPLTAPCSPQAGEAGTNSNQGNSKNMNGSKRRSVHIMTAAESGGGMQVMADGLAPAHAQRAGLGIGGGSVGRAERVVSMIEAGTGDGALGSSGSEPDRPGSGSFAKRFGSLLGRSSSVAEPDYKRHRPRSSIGGLGHKAGCKTPVSALPQVAEASGVSPPFSPGELQDQQLSALAGVEEGQMERYEEDLPLTAPVVGQSVGRSTTFSGKGKANGISSFSRASQHHRGASIGAQAAYAGGAVKEGTAERGKRTIPHSASTGTSWRPRLTSLQDGEAEEQRQVDGQAQGQRRTVGPGPVASSARTGAGVSDRSSDKIKPIYLKGLFSVATTSTRGPQTLREDLVKVLDRIGFQHREIKGGFECAHAPSIDLSSFIGGGSVGKMEGMRKKASKGSIGKSGSATGGGVGSQKTGAVVGNRGIEVSEGSLNEASWNYGDLASTPPSGGGDLTMMTTTTMSGGPSTPGSVQTSRFGPSPGTGPIGSQAVNGSNQNEKPNYSNNQKHQQQQQVGVGLVGKKYDLVVRFEIFIVKMPLLPGICGLQFRRISGNGWQYQTFARRILQELKL